MKKFFEFSALFFLVILSFFTRFFNLSYPSKVVFDEAHFGLYATKYFSHQYYFDIHPPLGKMLLALAGFFGKIKPGFDFLINRSYGDFNYLSLRFLPALLGSLFVLLIYFFVKELGFSQRVAFLSSFLILFDNAILVQSRLILLDIILLFFIFLALYLFFLSKRYKPFSGKWYLVNTLCGIILMAAFSIKWTGLGALGIVWFLIIFEEKLFSKPKKEILTKIGLLFILPFLLYFLVFALHFYLLPFSCQANCGAVLNSHLEGEAACFNNPPTGNLFKKFVEVHKLMLFSNLGGSGFHYYQSDWWTWPFMLRPIKYFSETKNDRTSLIYFFGNPIVWFLGIIGLLGYFYLGARNYFYHFKMNLPSFFYSKSSQFLVLGFLVYFLPFMAVKRYMLIYEYLPALVFLIILFSVFFESILKMLPEKKANTLFFGLLILILVGFLCVSPLTYGFSLDKLGFLKIWFSI